MKLPIVRRVLSLASSILPLAVVAIFTSPNAYAQDCVWGSFNVTRINWPDGTLNGPAHSELRSIIAANGGTIASATSTLTDAYLSGVDVFYTSLLHASQGILSVAEQTALDKWLASGGTLVVTADYISPAAYTSFTAAYGVTGYVGLLNQGFGSPVTNHALTAGVGSYRYAAEVTYSYGNDALLLGDNGFGDDFLVVLEPATGFKQGGRIVVYGDFNLFTDAYIYEADNIQLASNLAAWACSQVSDCLQMTLTNFAAGQTASWDITGGTEGERVIVVYGFQEGSTIVNGFGGYCSTFGIKGVDNRRVVGTANTSGGTATVTKRIPNGTSGTRVLTQASERNTCPNECMSNLVDEVIG